MGNQATFTHFTGGVNHRRSLISGDSTGSLALSGITTDDKIVDVWSREVGSSGTQTVTELTDEVTIPSDGYIKTSSTGTTNAVVEVDWVDVDRSG
jgi:hypothetical protein